MAIQKYDIGGVKDAITADAPFGKVTVKDLTKDHLLAYFRERQWMPLNTTVLYYNSHNFDLAIELLHEGKLRWRNCQGKALELA